jgi:hypothetical protein
VDALVSVLLMGTVYFDWSTLRTPVILKTQTRIIGMTLVMASKKEITNTQVGYGTFSDFAWK